MIQIHDHGNIIEVEPSDKSQLTRGIMRSSELLLSFRSDVVLDLHPGATVDFEGETFTLIYPSEVKKLWRGYYDYTVTLYSSAELLKQRLLKDPSEPGRTAFTFTGSAHDFATLVARSMGEGWSVGDCLVSDGDRMIAFREETCLSALARIAEDFHSEWVVERQTIAIRKQELWRDAPVRMSYGRGKGFLSGVSRSGDGDKLPISRLYVLGGSRNIDPATYGSRSLHLPDGSTALSSGVEGREAALDLSHIYPSRVGTVSEVVTVSEEKCFYDIKDASIPEELNYSDCRIPGEKAVIRFQSGALAGRELEIRQSESALEGYHHEERRFELVPREEDGFTFPSARWMPKAGDRYAVFGIALPPSYIKEAEERMLREAKRYLSDNKEPVYTFRGEVDGIWARKHWLEVGGKLVPGGHVLFSDPEFHPSGSVIRIVSTTQAVNDPHAPSITLSTAPVPGSFLSRLDRVEADEVVRREQIREVQRQQSQSYRQALEHLSMVDRAVEGLEGFTRRLKPSVLETMGILVGSQATQLDFVRAVGSLESVTPAINYDPDTKALYVGESVLRHQTIGITTMRDRRDPSEYRYWRLPEYVSPPLTDPDRSYYIYARAARVGTEGAFLLSEEPIPMESDPDYFHLLIGTLSSLDGGDRAYNRLYGFSMISPGQMVVDTISSANGRMSIDLARGEIYASSVSFSRPDGARGSLSDLAGEVDELQSHPPKIVDGKWHVWDGKAQTYVNTGDDARGETGKNGLSPKIVDGKWSVWDGSRWVSTGVPAQGPKGEQGDKGEKGEQGAPGKDVDPKVLNDLKTAVDDARRKLDDTVTKAELDGVVSAQEEHDIQAAKAALDAAKKAYDDAVKKAKELDGEIQVGGRNLLRGSRSMNRLEWGTDLDGTENPFRAYEDQDGFRVVRLERKGAWKTNVDYRWCFLTNFLAFKLDKETYTISFDYKSNYRGEHLSFSYWRSDGRGQVVRFNGPDSSTWRRGSITLDLTSNNLLDPSAKNECTISIICGTSAGQYTEIRRVKLERGTVATDWTPAPEDVQAEIDGAREQATKAQQSTDSLKGYVDGAYKDGIITEVEGKTIATYINEVEAMWSSAFGAFERVYVNPLLIGTPKTALSDAKITLAGAKDSLISQIQRAISDGKATAAEATETERLYNVYKGALRDFQRALKSAEEAIRDAGKTTGGRNLAVMSRMIPGYLHGELKKGNPGDKDYKVMQYKDFVYDPTYYKWEGTTPLTYRIQSVPDGRTGMPVIHYHNKDKRFIGWVYDWSYQPPGYTKTLIPPAETAYIRIGFVTPQAVTKIERGTVATDWTPAPEDVQAEIDRERTEREQAVREVATGLSSANTLIRSLEQAQDLKLDRDEMPEIGYLLAALKKPKGTTVAGGLLLSNQIILSDAEDDIISATLSGQRAKGAKALRLGIDYTDGKDAGTEQTALCNDGTGHLGDLYFGGQEIGFGATDSRYMQIGGTARSEYDMVNASTEIHKSQVPGTTVYKAGETLLDNFYLPGSNSELKYTAMISARADAEAQRRIVMEGGGPDGNPHFGGGYERPKRVVYYDRCSVTTSAYLRVTITRGGEEVYSATSPTVTARAVATGGRSADDSEITHDMRFDSESQEQAVTLTVPANIIRPNDFAKLTLVCSELRADRGGGGAAYASNIVSYLPYDTSKPMVAVTPDKASFFYGRSRYLLFNYLSQYVVKLVGDMLLQGHLTLKGDLTADRIICKTGGLYSGGVINEYGTVTRWVGRKITVSKVSTGRYKLTHNLGHINYVVQAIPVHSSDNNCFVIDGTETAHTVEVGVQWNSSWTNRAIHFVIYAQQ